MIKIHTLLALCIFLLWSSNLFAQDEFIIEEENEFGGQTTEFSDTKLGILQAVIYYGSDNRRVKEEKEFTKKSALLYGIVREVKKYFFDIKIQHERYFTPQFARKYLTRKRTDYFDRYTGERTKVEKFFTEAYLGHNITYYFKEKRTKVEWFYPQNLEGIRQQVTFFAPDGVRKTKKEYWYTKKTTRTKGYYRSVHFLEDSRKIKQIWYYTTDYAAKNRNIIKQIDHFSYHPEKLMTIQSNFFNEKGALVPVK